MSRVGRKSISIPEGVSIESTSNKLIAKGQLGEVTVNIPQVIEIASKDSCLVVNRLSNSKTSRALHGTTSRLIVAAIKGVSTGFEKKLELVGIGYRGSISEGEIILQVGYTHPVKIKIPGDLSVRIDKNTIIISGADKQKVGQFAAEIRSIRKPEPYKGKGIRYQGERIRMKQGKAVKAASVS